MSHRRTVPSSDADPISVLLGENRVTCTGLHSRTNHHEPRPTSTLADSNSLLVPLHRPQDRSTVDIEDLYDTLIASRDNQLPILPDLGTSCRILEPGNGLDDLSCPGRID
jgi:hypothetical protein